MSKHHRLRIALGVGCLALLWSGCGEDWSTVGPNDDQIANSTTDQVPGDPTQMSPQRKEYKQGLNGYAGCEDTYMIEFFPDDNFGGKIYIECMSDDGREDGGRMTPLIRFNDLRIAGCTVTACTLELYCYLSIGDAQVIELHEVLRDWEASEVTSHAYKTGHAWTQFGCGCNDIDAASTPVCTLVDSGGMGYRRFPLPTRLVQRWVDAPGNRNNGLLVRSPETGVVKDRSFRSAEMFIESDRPNLIIHYQKGLKRRRAMVADY